MVYVEGFDNNTYPNPGQIILKQKEFMPGPGLIVTEGDSYTHIGLNDSIIEMHAMTILKEELKSVSLNLETINKLLKGSWEDKNVAYELLDSQSKYISKILRALEIKNTWELLAIYREYIENNRKELSLKIL